MRRRQTSEKAGRFAESLAAIYLQIYGYKIISRRAKTPFGEIDIMARKRDMIIFAEVKYRRNKSDLETSLHPSAQKRIIKAADYITSRTPEIQPYQQRFDLILMAPLLSISLFTLPWGYMRHLKDAWRAY